MKLNNSLLYKWLKGLLLLSISPKKLLVDKPIYKDTDTGLTWQIELNNEEFSKDETFTWKESFKYAKRLNRQKYGGIDTWRVPTVEELFTIASKKPIKNPHFADISKTIYTHIKEPFLDSMKMRYQDFWTSTELTYNNDEDIDEEFEKELDYACYIEFENYGANYFDKDLKKYVRCVSG
ncbi:MAG: DUF1566 domain-containing protein [Campylobacterota bacterium]|nr:DUF1566 domain-containing protein [Campylobacterota bacterium]